MAQNPYAPPASPVKDQGHNWARILTLFFFVVAFATYAALFNEYATALR